MIRFKFFIAVVLLVASTLSVPSLYSQDELTIAVMDFQNLSNYPDLDYLEKAIPEILITDLSLSKKIKIVERTRLEEILKEMQLALSGAVDEKEAIEVGKVAGAKAILLGSIIRAGETLRIDSRLIDVSTSEVILAEKKEWTSDNEVIAAIDDLAEQIIKSLTGESIQIEEEKPSERAEFTEGKPVVIETALDNTYRLKDSDEPVYLQIELFSQEIEAKDRIPLNISLVIDRSGSMASERKLDYVKKSAEFVVNNLSATDVLSLVTYESLVQTPIPAQNADKKDYFLQTIRRITSGGSTNLSGGMLEGYAQTAENIRSGQVNRVLLLSDGLANRGITDPVKLQQICQEKSSQGISISAFGVGASYNEDLMLGLAEYGNGNYYFIDTPEKIPTIFSRELKGLLAVTAQNVKIEVEPQSGVVVEEVYGYISESDGRLKRVTIGDIFSNEQRTIVLKLKPPKNYSGSLELAKVILTYDDVVGKRGRIEDSSVHSVNYTNDKKLIEEHENKFVGQSAFLFTSSVRMQKAIEMVDRGKVEKAKGFLSKELESVSVAAGKYQSTELKKQILTIERYNMSIEEYDKKSPTSIGIMQKEAKYDMYQLQKRKGSEKSLIRPESSEDEKPLKSKPQKSDVEKPKPSVKEKKKQEAEKVRRVHPKPPADRKLSRPTTPKLDKKEIKSTGKKELKKSGEKAKVIRSKSKEDDKAIKATPKKSDVKKSTPSIKKGEREKKEIKEDKKKPPTTKKLIE